MTTNDPRCLVCGGELIPLAGLLVHATPPPRDHLAVPPQPATTGLDLAAIRARINRAHKEVGDIAAEGAHRRWRMSIPAQPGRDSDLVISRALADAEKLAAEVQRLRERWESAQRHTGELIDRAERAEALTAEILRHFTQHGHPGEPCLRTGWIREKTVTAWREAAGPARLAATTTGETIG